MPRLRSCARLGALLLCLPLASCSLPSSGIDELLQAPRLSEEQEAVTDALAAALGTRSFTLKYPLSGDYRSAFVFQDIDADGDTEAVAFYQFNGVDSGTRINILDMQDGRWRSVCEVPSNDNNDDSEGDIDYIRFENIESSDYPNIVIGWKLPNPSRKKMSIYTYDAGRIGRRFEQEYAESYFQDMSGDGLTDIALLSPLRRTPKLSIVSSSGGRIRSTGSVSLGDDVNGIAGFAFGGLGDGRRALFVDVELGSQYVTEIVTMEGETLTPLIEIANIDLADVLDLTERGASREEEPPGPEEAGEPLLEGARPDQKLLNYAATLRVESSLSADVNGDGIIEVPSTAPMLGYEELAWQEAQGEDVDEIIRYLTTYSVYRTGVMTPVFRACLNLDGGFLIRMPERWLGKVTLYSDSRTQWQFVKYAGSLSDLSIELLRVKIISKNDYQDRLETNPILLSPEQNGLYQIYGYIPLTEDEELAIDETELRGMFSLL